MRSLEIAHFGGITEVSGISSLESVLLERFGQNANEFLITATYAAFPQLIILVRDQSSAAYYIRADGDAGFVSRGAQPPGQMVTFYSGSPTEKLHVPSDAVIPFERARLAAREFLETASLPRSISWFEL